MSSHVHFVTTLGPAVDVEIHRDESHLLTKTGNAELIITESSHVSTGLRVSVTSND